MNLNDFAEQKQKAKIVDGKCQKLITMAAQLKLKRVIE
jgi:hypothetical protein